MSYTVSTVGSGAVGWQYLKATEQRQRVALESTPAIQRDTEYFRQKIESISSVAEFVGDPQLLRVALGAFGLEGDVQNRAFIEKVIRDGVDDDAALANKLADKTYLEFAKQFSVDRLSGTEPFTTEQVEKIVSKYNDTQFGVSLGKSDDNLRIALNLEAELEEISRSESSEDTLYYRILGDPPLRLAFETSFGLPPGFASIDIDQQAEVLKSSVAERFGTSSLKQFQDAEQIDSLVQLFLMRSSVTQVNTDSIAAQTALALLTA